MPPAEPRDGLLALRLGLGLDEIAETFDLGEVEPAVEEGAAGELAGFGESHAGQCSDAAQQRGGRRRASRAPAARLCPRR